MMAGKNEARLRLFVDRIGGGIESLGQQLPAESIRKCAVLLCELERWGGRMNLTAIRETDAMVSGHVLDSLSVRPFIAGETLIDVGTGAGFPGLPIAIAEPGIAVELLDSNQRKISFVQHVIGELGIPNAAARRLRAENYAPGRGFDTVIARALAPLPRLIELAGHLLAEKGVMLAQKGRYPARELKDISGAWEYSVTELAVPDLGARHVVALRRRNTEQ